MPGVDSFRKEVTMTVICGSIAKSTTKYTNAWHSTLEVPFSLRGCMGLSAVMEYVCLRAIHRCRKKNTSVMAMMITHRAAAK